MTIKVSRSSVVDWLSMKHRSLILSASREGRFFLKEYFLASLQSVIGRIQDNVVSFGPLAKNNEWHIVLKTEEAKNNEWHIVLKTEEAKNNEWHIVLKTEEAKNNEWHIVLKTEEAKNNEWHIVLKTEEAKNNEWHIVLKTEEAKNKLLSAGQLHVKGVMFWVRPRSWPRARSGAWCQSRPLGLAARLEQVSFCEPTSRASVGRVIWTNHHSANNQHPSNKLSENYRKKKEKYVITKQNIIARVNVQNGSCKNVDGSRSRSLGLVARLEQVSFNGPTSRASVCRVVCHKPASFNSATP